MPRIEEARILTVQQPWAWAIQQAAVVALGKTVENRSQYTPYRGPLLIHAGKRWSERGARSPRVQALAPPLSIAHAVLRTWTSRSGRVPDEFASGAVVAVAELADCHPDGGCCQPWGESSYREAGGGIVTVVYHLLLEDVRALANPVPWRGQLGLRRAPANLLAAVNDELAKGPA